MVSNAVKQLNETQEISTGEQRTQQNLSLDLEKDLIVALKYPKISAIRAEGSPNKEHILLRGVDTHCSSPEFYSWNSVIYYDKAQVGFLYSSCLS